MSRKQRHKQPSSDDMTSRNRDQWRDPEDHTGTNPIAGRYDTPQDYLGSEEFAANAPLMRANRVEQALNFMVKLAEEYGLKVRSGSIAGEKILIEIELGAADDRKLSNRLLKAYRAAGYESIPADIQFR